jgi:hypothetical protein
MATKKVHLGDGIYLRRDEYGVVTLTAENATTGITDTIVLSPEALLEMQALIQPRRMAAPGNIEVDLGRKPED